MKPLDHSIDQIPHLWYCLVSLMLNAISFSSFLFFLLKSRLFDHIINGAVKPQPKAKTDLKSQFFSSFYVLGSHGYFGGSGIHERGKCGG